MSICTSRARVTNRAENPDTRTISSGYFSGFSARFVTLARDVQLDILARTQQE